MARLACSEVFDPDEVTIGHFYNRNFPRAMPIEGYVELLDWTSRQVVPGKRGSTPSTLPPVLARLGLDAACWCKLVSERSGETIFAAAPASFSGRATNPQATFGSRTG
jgi:hypothetical protein